MVAKWLTMPTTWGLLYFTMSGVLALALLNNKRAGSSIDPSHFGRLGSCAIIVCWAAAGAMALSSPDFAEWVEQ